MPILTFPLALIGLAAPLGLVGIYLLRNRFRRQAVSSLLLWTDHRSPREGGAKMQRWRAPWLFLLEMLAMLLLVGAAIGPRWLGTMSDSPVVYVLDDSYSMQMKDGSGKSALEKAKEAVGEEIGNGRFRGRLVLAGREPRVLGSAAMSGSEAREMLKLWEGRSGDADLAKGVALAREIGGARGRVMVVTDRGPEKKTGEEENAAGKAEEELGGRVQWRAYGEARGNVAIVSAARNGGRVMVEVANFADAGVVRDVRLEGAVKRAEVMVTRVTLGAGERKRLAFDVGMGTGTVVVKMNEGDGLEADDRVILPSDEDEPVRVWLKISDEGLKKVVEKGLEATGKVKWVTGGGELVVSDGELGESLPRGAWGVVVIKGERVQGYVGPYVMDRGNALVEGLGLSGVVWGAGEDVKLTGRPVVMAGEKTLVSEEVKRDGRREVRMALNVEATNLTRMVDWPEWWWNVVKWRMSARAGLGPVMVRLGGEAELKVGEGVREVSVRESAATHAKPEGERRMAVREGRVVLEAERLGLWEIEAGGKKYELAVNAMDGRESDVRGAGSGSWGRWVDEPTLRKEYVNYAWMAALCAMGLLMVHLWMIGQSAGKKAYKQADLGGATGRMR